MLESEREKADPCSQLESGHRARLHHPLLHRIVVPEPQGREPDVCVASGMTRVNQVANQTFSQCLAVVLDPVGVELLPHVGCVVVTLPDNNDCSS